MGIVLWRDMAGGIDGWGKKEGTSGVLLDFYIIPSIA